jgi:hypothetical protein
MILLDTDIGSELMPPFSAVTEAGLRWAEPSAIGHDMILSSSLEKPRE